MEDIVAIISVFGSLGFVTYTIVMALVRSKEIGRQAQIMTRLIESASGAGEASALLESPAAARLFGRLTDRRALALERVLLSIQSGIVLAIVGFGLLVIRTQVPETPNQVTLLVLGVLAITLGVAFLAAAGVSYTLSRNWGLLRESADPTVTSRGVEAPRALADRGSELLPPAR